MPRVDVVVECPVYNSFRVQQIAGMFDLPPADKLRETFQVDLPDLNDPWTIGAVVGPSGSGKTTIAKAAFGERLYQCGQWSADKAVVDHFPECSARQVTQALTAVGFSSPPSWIKPYAALSNGEQFRCDLAKAILPSPGDAEGDLVVFDEFTSVVDRKAARIGSAAVSKAIRGGKIDRRFVAVTCHYDILKWLEPDWVLDMADGVLARRRLRRPRLELQIHRVHRSAWGLFKRYHYLSGSINSASHCYVASWKEEPVAFCAVLNLIGKRGRKRISRIVVLPDYQGVGIGGAVINAIAELYREQQIRMNLVTSHPAMISSLKSSKHWRAVSYRPTGNRKETRLPRSDGTGSIGRAIVSFEFAGSS